MLFKKCTSCNKERKLSDFHIRNKKTGSLHSQCKLCRNEKRRELRIIPKNKYREYKYEASRRGLKFELSYKEFKSFKGKPCHYCGDELDSICLDRIDNDLGYFINNVVSCCFKCNSIKHVYDIDDFLEHVEKIFMYQQKVRDGKQESSG